MSVVSAIEHQKIETGGGPCLLAEHLGMDSISGRGPSMPVSCASGGEVCALCACKAAGAADKMPEPSARPSCAKEGVLQEMLYKNLLWRQ